MSVRDLDAEELDLVEGICLGPGVPPKWKEVMAPCMTIRKEWIKAMMKRGLGVTIALDTRGEKKGLIEYCPVEFASEPITGGTSLFINCMWVMSPSWGKGTGKALLSHVIEKARSYGGLTVLGYESDKWFGFMDYMPSRFFKRFDFQEVDRDGSRVLLYLDLGGKENPLLLPSKKRTVPESDKTLVEILFNSQCPWSGWMVDKVARNLERYDVVVKPINTDDRSVREVYGLSRGVCINGVPALKRMGTVKEVEALVQEVASRKGRKLSGKKNKKT
ncbi:MAG: GNAT family N-acetyltransferase [Candidatus Thorarchaeota archaeon]|nr:GNAT family N-acetyltransferase [Candidatus Thorarchaeota archaeon]